MGRRNKKKKKWVWIASKPVPFPVEAANDDPISVRGIENLWEWAKADCPVWETADGRPHPVYAILRDAVSSTNQLTLGSLSFHPNSWVRLGVAGNPYTPIFAMWGDGLDSFGLAGDHNRWVRATVLARMPQPPATVVASLSGATSQIPNRQNPAPLAAAC